MANGDVVDELVVKLTLDASAYKKADKKVDSEVTKTEKKRVQEDDKRKKRETAQLKRTKESTVATKGLGLALRGLSIGMAALLGVGSAGGLVTAVAMLAGYETNLRRAAVSTNMSNREMQAWGSTARRLGADAQAGAQAVADLAREQQQFNLTGNAPTMQALARLGVRVGSNVPVADMLGQAQQIYRQSSPGQQKQIESGLAAQGVSSDLIVMIKSETDAREAYTKSLAESATENRKALDAVTDALTGLSNSAINVANTIATLVQPAVEQFAHWVSENVQNLSALNDRIIAAGGGLQGLTKVLTEDFPGPMHAVIDSLTRLGEIVDVTAYWLNELWKVVKFVSDWVNNNPSIKSAAKAAVNPIGNMVSWFSSMWPEIVDRSRKYGPAPVQNWLDSRKPSAGAAPARAVSNAQNLMSKLVSQYGLTVPQAAAVAVNLGGESGFNPAAFNSAGGGTGARGLAQWRGNRTEAFKKKYGMLPDQASIDQQLDFMFTDPYERSLMNRSLSGGGADTMGEAFSRIFEAHGNAAETARRGVEAAKLAQTYSGPSSDATTQGGTNFNIQSVTVQANNPGEFVGGIKRLTGPQNYNSANR